ncbi:MAG TPA: SusD/RagB family nutrient-binding outer membrane lipoprotein [Flavobacteriaceae bacterium]|nr:SusD/RagB family nutrient-binding outer membrane lipoprotein [Flavobacteriaceae bacterium]
MKKIILLALLLGMSFSSCEDFEGWNVDTKNPSSVDANFLLTRAQQQLFFNMTSTNVNENIMKLFAQYWNEATYTDETNYDIRGRDIGGVFSRELYRDVLIDLKEASNIISENEFLEESTKSAQIGTLELLMVYTFHVLVDTYGYIPYTEALQGADNLVPKYDQDSEIYDDLFARIDAALVMLNASGTSFSSGDLIYGGDTSQWKKFGNSLKLRMAVRTDDYDHARSVTLASAAVAAGVFTSEADNAAFPFETTPPNTNALWESLVQSGRNDFVMAATFVDYIVPLNDPRTPVFMADNLAPDPYFAGPYGSGSSYSATTHPGDIFYTPDLEGIILSYDELQFLLAEAVERGLISGDAEMYYNEGVKASIMYWGGSEGDADTYLAQPSVAYATAAATWKEKIGNQKYIALYGRGFEAWSSWRVLDFPNIMQRPPISGEAVPRRYLYGNADVTLNEANYEAAAAAMGGDLKSSRVFWDITGVGN